MRVGVTEKRFVKMNIRAGGGNATTLVYSARVHILFYQMKSATAAPV